MEQIKIENFEAPINGYRRAALEVLARALDDICPIEEIDANADPAKRERLMREQEERVRNRFRRFAKQEAEIDKEWDVLERQADKEFGRFKADRKNALEKIESTYNGGKIIERIAHYEEELQSRINTIKGQFLEERNAYELKIQKAKNRGKKVRLNTVNAKKRQFDREEQRKIEFTKHRYAVIISNVKKTDNRAKVDVRLKESEEVWARREQRLREKFALRQQNHNHKRIEQDQIRLALEWFIFDIDKVNHWCMLAGISLMTCYYGVRRRLDMLSRSCPEIEEVFNRIKAGEIQPPDTGYVGIGEKSRVSEAVL